MLQQQRIEILYHKLPEIFRGIIPEKCRYFSGFRGNFRTHNPTSVYCFFQWRWMRSDDDDDDERARNVTSRCMAISERKWHSDKG